MKASELDSTTAKIKCKAGKCNSLEFLKPYQVSMIDDALISLGEYGELRLVVEKGRLRFLVMQRSYDVLKWNPENILEEKEKKEG